MASRPDTQNGTSAASGPATGTALDVSSAPRGEPLPAASAPDAFIGRVLSHYRLEQRLGAGGMGLLYRATDLTLGRAVAVKLLARHLVSDQAAKTRFVQEARAASALDHSNIATVYDIGEADGELFIVMALYEGETLQQRLEKGRLPIDEAVGILRQVALGLEVAHRAGIVHRDIKPANILITGAGTVKILDFGVAKLMGQSQAQLTQAGQQIGTMLYMSPEQLGGEPADARSDLWSLGVLAHEMVAGASPFRAESGTATAARILNDEPASLAAVPGVPDWLSQLVSQLLEKDPGNRPQSASDVLRRLESANLPSQAAHPSRRGGVTHRRISRLALAYGIAALAIAAAGLYLYVQRREMRNQGRAVKSLVVLPFVNASGNADMEYLSDGIAETLIDNLSQIPELQVIARNTAFRYKGKDVDLQKLRRELSVGAVLSGRIQQRGDTLLVHADLVHLETGLQLWGEKYNRKLTDLLAVEAEIAKAISDKLRPRLAVEVQQRVTRRPTESPEAYQLYLRGRYFWNMRTKQALDTSIEYFQKAIDADPKYALAYVGLADSHSSLAYYEFVPTKESGSKSEAAILKALALDDQLGEAHATLGLMRVMQWDWVTAEREFRRAIALNPSYAEAHNWYGLYWLFGAHSDKAAEEFERAQQLDPASAAYHANLGVIFCNLKQYDRGTAYLKESLRLAPNYAFSHLPLAVSCYLPRNMFQEAIGELKQGLEKNPADSRFSGALAYTYARAGNRDGTLTLLRELEERDKRVDVAMAIAYGYVGLDDKDRAFEWLEKAYQRHSPALVALKTFRGLDPLSSDPRFAALVRRIGFPP